MTWFVDVSGNNSVPIFGCAGGCVEPKPMMMMVSFCSTQPPAHPEEVEGVISLNVGKSSYFDAAVCPRNFHWIRLPPKLPDTLLNSSSNNVWKTRWTFHSHANYEEWIWTSRDEAIGMWLFERPVLSWIMIFQGIILNPLTPNDPYRVAPCR